MPVTVLQSTTAGTDVSGAPDDPGVAAELAGIAALSGYSSRHVIQIRYGKRGAPSHS